MTAHKKVGVRSQELAVRGISLVVSLPLSTRPGRTPQIMTEAIPAVAHDSAEQVVTELYQRHRLRLIGTALVLTGDRPTAEDVVQEAFAGLYRAMPRLADPDKALGCRLVHRARTRSLRLHSQFRPDQPVDWSAESAVLAREESRLALQAVARLRGRAREVLAMRYLLDMSDGEIAAALGVSKGTVSSTASRALAALASTLKEQS
jgi:RNA polymerase sigma factor (sigma-70 family)